MLPKGYDSPDARLETSLLLLLLYTPPPLLSAQTHWRQSLNPMGFDIRFLIMQWRQTGKTKPNKQMASKAWVLLVAPLTTPRLNFTGHFWNTDGVVYNLKEGRHSTVAVGVYGLPVGVWPGYIYI